MNEELAAHSISESPFKNNSIFQTKGVPLLSHVLKAELSCQFGSSPARVHEKVTLNSRVSLKTFRIERWMRGDFKSCYSSSSRMMPASAEER